MATADHSIQDDGEVVAFRITLIPHPDSSDASPFPEREFTLSSQTPTIRIGRASKVPTKGCVAAKDNAWFESPVMSRHHAELLLDVNSTPKTILVKDIGSLHGTFHAREDDFNNESRLEQQKPVRLSNGDTLRFGTDIFRSKETFPPCLVDVFISRLDYWPPGEAAPNTNRVFTIPDDDIDDDYDSDSWSVGSSVVMTVKPLVCIPACKNDVQHDLSIDLTQDEAGPADNFSYPSSATVRNKVNSDVIDLTSEPDGHSDQENRMRLRRTSTSIPMVEPPTFHLGLTISTQGSDSSTGIDHPQEPITFNSELDPNPRYRPEEDTNSEDIQLSDSDDESVMAGDVDAGVSNVSEDTDDEEEEEEGENESTTSELNDGLALPDSCDDDRDSIDDLPYSDDISSSSSEEITDPISNSSSPAPNSSLNSSPNPPVSKEEIFKDVPVESSDAKRPFVTPCLFTSFPQHSTPAHQFREPSPSDAAMFKSRPILGPDHTRAMVLGKKSGKFEYFAAREKNRTNLIDQLSPPPVSAIRETLGEASQHHVADVQADGSTHLPLALGARAEDEQTNSAEEPVQTGIPASDPPIYFDDGIPAVLNEMTMPEPTWQPWSTSGEKFINNPRSEDLPSPSLGRPQSPELDMTSAYTFQLSKMATESNSSQKSRRVEIQDLLTQEPSGVQVETRHDQVPRTVVPPAIPTVETETRKLSHEPSMKRSFDDAFRDEIDELGQGGEHEYMNTSSEFEYYDIHGQRIPIPDDEFEKAHGGTTYPPPIEVQTQAVAIPKRQDNFQPSKRRRFAQAAACVALGGAAAFTFMVSTAPIL
ncbi:hypothetical protein GGS26DRAFT_561280 [Hypomontagnella submonticulosa]|nr:hypothetical protein GGS26DRAFT_561280 [Hypomontagnella submonticulosa]